MTTHIGSDEEPTPITHKQLKAILHAKETAHRRIAAFQVGAYVLLVIVSALGWWQIEQEAGERCEAGRVNRQALVDNVFAIEQLGRNLVLGSTDPNAPTPEQQQALTAFANYRKSQIQKLDTPICGGRIVIDGSTVVTGQ